VTMTTGLAANDLTGRVLAGRYRLLGPIGTGAGARVFVAEDVKLRRQVAVKVLHSSLAEDAAFLRRFRAEAQVAASLHHPNIVAVYDWGEDSVPFIVLELLAGGSLRGVLDRGLRLSPAQAARLGSQVTAGLEYAHNRGVVHRDIKPANLLFDERGIPRIADFGLAGALAEASWTEPQGSVVGTVRYAAPEQGTGAALDGRADLYAVALVLTEAVTGKVPHVADTPLGTLGARMRQPIVVPTGLGPLGTIIERAGRPNPSARYPDAATMGEALADAGRRLPRAEPLVLAGLSDAALVDPHPTSMRPETDDATVVTDDPATAMQPGMVRPAPRRFVPRNWVPIVVAGVILAALIAAGVALAGTTSGATVTVPSFVGRTQDEAQALAADREVKLQVEERNADDPAGIVLEQDPGSGAHVGDGSTVRIVVSRGPPPIPIPDVAGQAAADAQAALEREGFVVEVQRQYDEEVPVDITIATDPASGGQAAPESRVVLIVSDGPAPVPVPAVAGLGYDQAVAELDAARLIGTYAEDYSETVPEGQVIGTNPPEGQLAPRDSEVAIVVSLGPPLVDVPNLRSQSVEAATDALRALGLKVDVEGYSPGGTVRAVDPPPGTTVRVGTRVTLFL
jgi:eukaryotic-like serine/threonine-protein kinase